MKRSAIILIAVLVATVLFLPKHLERRKMEAASRDAEAQRVQLRQHVEQTTVSLRDLRGKLESQQETRGQLARAIAKSEHELAKSDPDSYWATPPVVWPQWDVACPYIWVRKEVLPGVPIEPFTSEGILNPLVASVLALSGEQKAKLDAELSKLTGDFHKLESDSAELSDDHLEKETGEKITIKIKPNVEDANRFKNEFETDLTDTLGDQRGGLLISGAGSWLRTQFDQSTNILKTITMVREEHGTYRIAVRQDYSWSSTTLPRELIHLGISAHLLHFFDPILTPSNESALPQ